MLIGFIIGCEIAFWVVLAVGLIARYPLRLRRTSTVLLVCVPLVDVALLIASIIDLRRGAMPSVGHGLAAAYIGFSVAFGHSMIRWADQRFAYRYGGGPPPWRPPRYGRARVRYEWREFGKGIAGWAVACALLLVGSWYVDGPERARPLLTWISRLSAVMVMWLIFGPVLETVFPRRDRRDQEPEPINN